MVSVALDVELHREVALKEIQPDQADDLASRGRFVLEAEVTGRLEHPGVVPVYGLGTSPEGRPYYAMRFVRGESLKEAIDRFHQAEPSAGGNAGGRAIALRQLLSRFLDVCDAVAYAHSRGVIHRDLKPANILLGPYGETLVVDWGLAKIIGRDDLPAELSAELTLRPASASGSSETQAGSAVGTPAYMSPGAGRGTARLAGAGQRHLQPRGHALLSAHGPAAVDDREIRGGAAEGAAGRFSTAQTSGSQRAGGPGGRRPQGHGVTARRALSLRESAEGGNRTLAGRRAGARAYREPLFTRLARRAEEQAGGGRGRGLAGHGDGRAGCQ